MNSINSMKSVMQKTNSYYGTFARRDVIMPYLFLSGYYSADVTFYDSSNISVKTLTNAGSNDMFIVIYNKYGSILWVAKIGGTGADQPVNLLLDSGNNVYISGTYTASVTLYNSNDTTFKTLINAGGSDTFIAKYNSNGIGLWASRISGSGADQPVNLSLDSENNVYISGTYSANVTLYNTTDTTASTFKTLTNVGGNDTFIAKYNSNGVGVWATRISDTSNNQPVNLSFDSKNNVYILGSYTANVTLYNNNDTTFKTFTISGLNDTFISKYDSSGNGLWATRIIGSGLPSIKWNTITLSGNWESVSMSSTGQYQTVMSYGTYIYISSDYGNNWSAKMTDAYRDWKSVCTSSTGQSQTAVVYGGKIYISSDSGNTWNAKDASRNWNSVCMSSTGQYQTAVVFGGQIYISSDSGNTWNAKDASRNWISVCMSSTSQYQTAVGRGGQIYISSDSGNTWNAKDSARDWQSVCMSSTGQYQTAVVYSFSGQIYISSDYGNTWNAKDSNRLWYSVSMSSTGQYQTAVVVNGLIYMSNNYGNTWKAQNINRTWYSVSMSSNGQYQTAVNKNSTISSISTLMSNIIITNPVNLLLDSTNNIYISIYSNADLTLYNSTDAIYNTLIHAGEIDTFVAKYDNSGNCVWATRIIDTSNNQPVNLLLDSTNNVYISGYYGSTVTFYNSIDTSFNGLINAGSNDTFIAKYDNNGNGLWATRISGTGSDIPVNLLLDSANNVYISGYYASSLTLYNSDNTIFNIISNMGGNDMFISKYNNNGMGVWSTRIGDTGSDIPVNLLLDSANNVYISGYYGSTVTLYNSTIGNKTLTNRGSNDTFISNYDNNGLINWIARISGVGSDIPVNLLLDSNNNVYISGYYNATVTLYNSTDTSFNTLTNAGSNDTFIAKYDTSGMGLWATRIGGTGIDQPVNLLLDSENNVYISGTYSASVTLYNSDTTSFKTSTNAGRIDTFIAKYDSNGMGVWATRIGGTNDDVPVNLLLDSDNNVYISGYYISTLTLYNSDNTTFATLTNAGSNDMFISKYDSTGMGVWVTRIGGTGNDRPVNLLLDSANNVYISGYYGSNLTLYNSDTTSFSTLINAGGNDVFIAKYNNNGMGIWSTRLAGTGAEIPVNLLLDSDNNVYISGYYGSNLTLYNSIIGNKTLINAGGNDTFISNYDNNGLINWIARISGTGSDIPVNMISDSNNNAYITGYYSATVTLYNSTDTSFKTLTNAGSNHTFIAKYDTSGMGVWATRISDTSNNLPVNLIMDSTNNVYISGYYNNTLTLYNSNDTTFKTLTNAGSNDTFIAKYDNNGNGLWATRISGTGSDIPVNLLLDSENNVYISGYYAANVTLYNSDTATFATLTNAGGNDVFIAKYNNNGMGVWNTRLAGTGSDQPVNLLLDSNNNVHISGYYNNTLTLYNANVGNKTIINAGANDTFIFNYDNNGLIDWIARISGVGSDIPVNLLLDSNNNVYISGYYVYPITLYNSNDTSFKTLTSASTSNEIFIAKYDSSGMGVWATRIGSTGSDIPVNLLLDSTNNVYISGTYTASVTLYNSTDTSFKTLTNAGSNDTFIAKYDSSGMGVWATRLSGTGSDIPVNLLLDSENNVYISGTNFASVTLYNSDNTTFKTLTTAGGNDIFIAKYDSTGMGVWATKIVTTNIYINSFDRPVNLLLDSANNVYISGYYAASLTLYNSDTTSFRTLTNAGSNDTFIGKYDTSGMGVWATRISSTGSDIPVNLLLDSDNNVYISGYYSATVTLYNSDTTSFNTFINVGSNDTFVAKYDSNGNGMWGTWLAGTGTDQPVNLLLDSTNNVYISGYYGSDLTLYNSSIGNKTFINSGGNDIFISNYDNNGLINWITRISGTGNDIPVEMKKDSANNVYISGYYGSTITLYNSNDTTFKTLTNAGSNDTFVVKYDASGNGVWATRIAGSGADQPVNLLLDSTNNVYISGYYVSTITLYNSNDTSFNTLTNAGNNDTFVVKYDASGNGVWATKIGGTGSDQPVNLLLDSNNTVYISGYYAANVTLYNSDTTIFTTLFNAGVNDIFIAKYNNNGMGVWTTRIGGTGSDQPVNLLLDSTNSVYISGYYNSTLTLYNSTFGSKTLINSGGNDTFIFNYDNNGLINWITRISGTGNDIPVDMKKDSENNVYIYGYYGSTITLYNSNDTSFKTLTNSGTYDTFIVKYNSNGNGVWATRIAGTYDDIPVNLLLDSSNNVYISGYYSANLTLYNSNDTTFKTLTYAGGNDTFVVKYDASGMGIWTTRIGFGGYDVPINLLLDSTNNVYISGYYTSTPLTLYNSNDTTFKTLTNDGIDTFIAKYDTNGNGVWATRISDIGNNQPVNLLLDSSNNVYISGYYDSIITLYNTDTTIFTTLFNAGVNDIFIAKYDSSGNGVWATRLAGTGSDQPVNLLLDSTNSVYISGYYNSTLTLYSTFGSKTLINSGGSDTFIFNYDNNGLINWITRISGSGNDIPVDMKKDSENNVYISGYYGSTITLYNSNDTSFKTLTNAGGSDTFIAKYNSNGNGVWATRIAGTNDDRPVNLLLDSDNNVYISGIYGRNVTLYNSDNTTFKTFTNNVYISGTYSTFIVKYNSNGNGVWATRITGNYDHRPVNLLLDSNNNVYISGYYFYPITLYNSNDTSFKTLTSASIPNEIFIAKYDNNGNGLWATKIGGTGSDQPVNLLLDSENNVYISGYYSENLTLYNSNDTTFKTLTNAGSNHIFIAKYDSNGNGMWGTWLAGTGSDQPVNLLLDSTNNVYISGYYGSDLTLYNSSIGNKTLINSGGNDIFISNYDNNGLINWITRISGTGNDIPVEMKKDSANNLYISGFYSSTLILYNSNDSAFKTLTNSGNNDTFIAKYDSNGNGVWATRISGSGSETSRNMLLDSQNNIYITVSVTGNATLYNSGDTNTSSFKTLTNPGVYGMLITAKYNSNGIGLWASKIDTTTSETVGEEYTVKMDLDLEDKLHVSLIYNGNVNIYNENGTLFTSLQSTAANDGCLVKYNTNGSVAWKIALTSGNNDGFFSIKFDSLNNLYVMGGGQQMELSLYNRDNSLFKKLFTGVFNIKFVAKYNNDGFGIWAAKLASNGQSRGGGLTPMVIDNANNIYIMHMYETNTTLFNSDDNAFMSFNATGDYDALIAKYDSNGNGVWAYAIEGSGIEQLSTFVLGSDNSIYVSGYYSSSLFLFNSNYIGSMYDGDGTYDTFIVKYNSNGNRAWVTKIGGTGADQPVNLLLDSSNNVYISGTYTASVTLYNTNDTTFKTLTNAGGSDTFIAKYNSNGIGLWATKIGGTGSDIPVNLLLHSTNNLYISGYYSADINSIFTTLFNAGVNDTFIAKYDTNGNGLWATRIAGSGADQPVNLLLNSSNNVYISGYYASTLTLYNTNDTSFNTLTASGGNDTFIAKYDSSGNGVWATRISDIGNNQPVNLLLDLSNNVYISGYYDSIITLYNSDTATFATLTNRGSNDTFIAKYDTNGNGVWATQIGGTGSDIPVNLLVDSTNNVYISGYYTTATLTLYYNSIGKLIYTDTVFKTLTNAGSTDTFIAKYDTNGNGLWATRIAGSGADQPVNLLLNSSNNIYITGNYAANVILYNSNDVSFKTLTNAGSNDTFVVKYDSNGNGVWATRISGSGADKPVNLLLDSSNNVYISGYYDANVTLYNSNDTTFNTLTNVGSNDTFVVKYDSSGNGLWTTRIPGIGADQPVNLLLDSNNTVYISGFYNANITLYYNSIGKIIFTDTTFKTLTNGSNDTFVVKYDSSGNGVWATMISGTGGEIPVDMKKDSENNVYITGYYSNILTLYNSNDTSFKTLNNRGSNDTFIAKYNSSGNGLWATLIAGTGNDIPVNLLLDSTNNVYISGYYTANLTLYNSNDTSYKSLTNAGSNDTFLVKYDASGNGVWATRIAGSGADQPVNLLLDLSNNVYISGYYAANVTLYNSNDTSFKTLTNTGSNDTFIVKYDASGNGVWATNIGGTGIDQPVNLLLDSNNTVYISGYYSADITLYYNSSGKITTNINFKTLTNAGINDTFIAKYDSSGNGLWATRISDTSNNQPVNLLLDSTNNVYISGYYGSTLTLYNSNDTSFNTLTNRGRNDTFIAKYDSTGNGVWVNRIASTGADIPVNLILGSNNNVYISGYYSADITLYYNNSGIIDSNIIETIFKTLTNASAGTNDTFIAKYDSSGNGVWATRISDTSNNQPVNLLLDSTNNVYISGYYGSTLSLYNSSTDTVFKTLTASGGNDTFIAKYNTSGNGVWSTRLAGIGSDIPVNLLLDSANNIYISGYYDSSLTLYNSSNTTFKTLTASGSNDTFIAKYDNSGNGTWATQISDTSNNQPVKLLLDSTNNVYISGYYGSTLTLYNSNTTSFNTLTASGGNDTFIAKYDSSGNGVWATRIGSTGNDQPVNLLLDSTNNIYLSGFYNANILLYYNSIGKLSYADTVFKALTNAGGSDTFIAKYDSSGNGVWATRISDTSNNQPVNLLLDSTNNVYISGYYDSSLTLYNSSNTTFKTLTASGSNDTFIAKYDNSGNGTWATRISDIGNNQPVKLLLDSTNNVYISGYYGSTLTLYNSNTTNFKTLTNAGSNDTFIAKYDSSGNGVWASRMIGFGSDIPVNLLLDSNNNVYTSGLYTAAVLRYYNSLGILKDDEEIFKTLTNSGGNDTFVAKYDASGNGVWANRIASAGTDQPVSMVINKNA